MAEVLLISAQVASAPIPELSLLAHSVAVLSPSEQVLTASAESDVVVVDARTDLVGAKAVCQMFASTGVIVPRLLVVSERGLPVVTAEWGVSDLIVEGAGPAEYEARIRLLTSKVESVQDVISGGGVVIDEAAYSVTLNDKPLDLTYTEFELLKYLVLHPGRVFSRELLLAEVWGYDYYGGTRTVDVHVRRLRSKLGVEHESLIATVRNVGYRFTAKA
ncbi:MAG TPA: response regulator transcription factor [Propionibacteriaceae bacterium]|nr:response regulator transcription factor [Propionibacteriaceae bacterium]HPZ49585.1 response regulator transcription factor [Propionibacteriaceae bacterium]HQE32046.1 response regulator transcription factor [Propionibacteriaceae bacterium]